MNELEQFRKEKDEFFAKDRESPLRPSQKRHFRGLKYFPENPDLRLEGSIEEFPQKKPVDLQTSTGDVQTYLRFGQFQFSVDGQPAQLTVYADEEDFFLPFADGLAGVETYGAGRYLEPHSLGEGRFLIDFNYAYNPYCAYNEHWSCPIPPAENRIKAPIRAGEMIFKSHP